MRTSRERTTFRVASTALYTTGGAQLCTIISSTMFYLALEFLVRFLLR